MGGPYQAVGRLLASPRFSSLVWLRFSGVPGCGPVRGDLLLLFPDLAFAVVSHKPHLLQEASCHPCSYYKKHALKS